jgi:hypothetical protein
VTSCAVQQPTCLRKNMARRRPFELDSDDQFQWGDLGESYWRELGGRTKASEIQIKFSCAKSQGASNAGAAKLAGYSGSDDQLRQAGYRAFKSNKVQAILAIVEAEDTNAPIAGIMTKADRALRLSQLSKSPDPSLSIRAIEALNKMAERDAEMAPGDDGLSEDRAIRDLLQIPGGPAAAVCLHMGRGVAISRIALLHDVHKACMSDPAATAVWNMAVNKCSTVMQQDLVDLLARPDWQWEIRVQLWREVGVEIDEIPNIESLKDTSGEANANAMG